MGCQCWYPKGVHGAPSPPLQEPSKASSFCFPIQATSSGRSYPGEAARCVSSVPCLSLLTSTPGKKADITQELTDPRCNLQPRASSPGQAAPPTSLQPLLSTHSSACPPSASQQQTPSALCLSCSTQLQLLPAPAQGAHDTKQRSDRASQMLQQSSRRLHGATHLLGDGVHSLLCCDAQGSAERMQSSSLLCPVGHSHINLCFPPGLHPLGSREPCRPCCRAEWALHLRASGAPEPFMLHTLMFSLMFGTRKKPIRLKSALLIVINSLQIKTT